MSYTKKKFLEDVAKEAEALKEHATKEEISKLSIAILDPTHSEKCLYGLMTGNCYSERASELIFKSCTRYFHNPGIVFGNSRLNFSRIRQKVNGSSIDGVDNGRQLGKLRLGSVGDESYYSAVEIYITAKDARPKNLISFLKGERKDLVL